MGIVALMLASLYAGKAGLADIELRIAQGLLDRWSREMKVPEWEQWAGVRRHLGRAFRLDPGNPDLLNELGRLHELGAVDKTVANGHVVQTGGEALSYYRKSAAVRPTWPHTWASVATVKLKLLQLDSEFLMAIEKAIELGPWEPPVQIRVVEIGFAAWKVLPDKARAMVVTAAQRALKRQGPDIIRLAQRYGRACDVVYPLVVEDERLAPILTELGACHPC